MVGFEVGNLVGAFDGSEVVGASVGELVGEAVGEAVGAFVGEAVGEAVISVNKLSLLVGDAEVSPTSIGSSSHSSFCLLLFHGNLKLPDSNGLPFGLLFFS